jgi:hypothetical protein
VKRIVLVLTALLVAVHVGIPALGMAAPLPVFFAFAAVIAWQLRLIWHAAGFSRIRWAAGS